MAPHEQLIEADPSSPRGTPSAALGVIAAVSAAGLVAMRMKSAPLMFLAGAAAVALLGRKRPTYSSRSLVLMPERPPEPAHPSDRKVVDAWLARQIEREQQAPVITLDVESLPESAPPAPEPLHTALDALLPTTPIPEATCSQSQSGHEDAFETVHPDHPAVSSPLIFPIEPSPTFAMASSIGAPPPEITTPVETMVAAGPAPVASPPPAQETHEAAAFQSLFETMESLPGNSPATSFLTPAQVFPEGFATPSNEPANASWLLGIEPLPSWEELGADPPSVRDHSSADLAFLSEPPGMAVYNEPPFPAVLPPAQPKFVPALFQAGALPDEISVLSEVPAMPSALFSGEPAPAAAAIPSMESPPTFPPAPAPLAECIPVTLAVPGEASFDPPWAALEKDPTPRSSDPPPSPPLRPLAPVVDAEIVIRPRGLRSPIQQVVPPTGHSGSQAELDPQMPADPSDPLSEDQRMELAKDLEAHIPTPPASPDCAEKKPRKSWLSWWRGD